MTTAATFSVVFNYLIHEDHTYKAIWMLNTSGQFGQLKVWVEDEGNHNILL